MPQQSFLREYEALTHCTMQQHLLMNTSGMIMVLNIAVHENAKASSILMKHLTTLLVFYVYDNHQK